MKFINCYCIGFDDLSLYHDVVCLGDSLTRVYRSQPTNHSETGCATVSSVGETNLVHWYAREASLQRMLRNNTSTSRMTSRMNPLERGTQPQVEMQTRKRKANYENYVSLQVVSEDGHGLRHMNRQLVCMISLAVALHFVPYNIVVALCFQCCWHSFIT